MASTSSIGSASCANASSAQAFYTQFSSATSTLLAKLSSVTTQDSLQGALEAYARFNVELTAAVDSGVLPAHDQGVHKRRLAEVAAVLEETRRRVVEGEAQPQLSGVGEKKKKGGFAFKRKQSTKPAATTTTTTTTTAAVTRATKQSEQPTIMSATPTVAIRSNHLTVASLHNTSYVPSEQTESKSLSLDLKDISNSLVDLRPLSSNHSILSVQLRGVTSSILLLPPIEGSIMIHDLHDSLLAVPSCHQFRMHTSSRVVVELSTKRGSVVTVEACKAVKFVARGGGEDELRVQDFDDLINSAQLKREGVEAGSAGNFSVTRAGEASKGIADKVDELLLSGVSSQDCLEKIIKVCESEEA